MDKDRLNAVYNFIDRLEIDETLKVRIYLALLNQPNIKLQQILNIIND